jgi:hypothetical protein
MDQQVVIVYEIGAYLLVFLGVSVINLKVLGVTGPLGPHKPGPPRSQ